jgi:hypothetical protein
VPDIADGPGGGAGPGGIVVTLSVMEKNATMKSICATNSKTNPISTMMRAAPIK